MRANKRNATGNSSASQKGECSSIFEKKYYGKILGINDNVKVVSLCRKKMKQKV